MAPAGNKAKRLSSVSHTIKTIHHHYLLLKSREGETVSTCVLNYLSVWVRKVNEIFST